MWSQHYIGNVDVKAILTCKHYLQPGQQAALVGPVSLTGPRQHLLYHRYWQKEFDR